MHGVCKKSRKETSGVIVLGIFFLGLDIVFQLIFRSVGYGTENRGVSFGLASEVGLIVSYFAFCLLIAWFIFDLYKHKQVSLFLFLTALGGVGNILSRLIWGSVWDYICISFFPFCFNISDVLISLGVASYILGVNGRRNIVRR